MPLVPYALTRPFLFGLDPERAHDLAMASLARLQNTPAMCLWQQARVDDPVTVAGLRFPNRIGLAAGLDKNGECIDGLGAMGFGFIEVGTVTPKPQPGNAKPRMFRLPAAQALINRLGFNNQGLAAFVANVQRARSFRAGGGIVGLNIGKTAATPLERAVDDYLLGLDGVYPHADYVTVNISSPNTKNLRELQSDEALDALLSALMARRRQLASAQRRTVPVFVKIAPDLDEPQVGVIAAREIEVRGALVAAQLVGFEQQALDPLVPVTLHGAQARGPAGPLDAASDGRPAPAHESRSKSGLPRGVDAFLTMFR